MAKGKKMSKYAAKVAKDDAYDKKKGIKEDTKKDKAIDKKRGVK